MSGERDNGKTEFRLTKKGFLSEIARLGEAMGEGNIDALPEIYPLLKRGSESPYPSYLESLPVRPEVTLSLFVAGEILTDLNQRIGLASRTGLSPNEIGILSFMTENLGNALSKSLRSRKCEDVSRDLGYAVGSYIKLVNLTEDEV